MAVTEPESEFAENAEQQFREAAELAANMSAIAERSQEIWRAFAESNAAEAPRPLGSDPMNTAPAFAHLGLELLNNPKALAEATLDLWAHQAELWRRQTARWMGLEDDVEPLAAPARGDKRFRDEDWTDNVVFDYVKQSYLLTSKWMLDTVHEVGDLTPAERKKVDFYTRNIVEAMSPSNFATSNPEVLRTTLREKGENLVRGLDRMLKDLERGKGHLLISQTDLEAFEVGRDMATTPGEVIHRAPTFELIQYAPSTDTVKKTPILFIPPWINKFYILDLSEKKSMIRWLVGEGFTVFVVSWVNPDRAQTDETWESYMTSGVLTALGKVLEETGEEKAHLVGYCIGGTMLGTTLAHMANAGDDRAASATFFTTQLDFTDAGELQVFVDEETLKTIDEQMEDGVLKAQDMASAFNMLRSSDLIWSFVVQNYMLGKEPFAFDLLYWNADSTSMPAKVHRFYLENFYAKNTLAKGEMRLCGEALDLSKVRIPSFHVAAKEDHIAPPDSAFRAAKLLGGRSATFILAGSGHIAGVVNPPAAGKYQHWTRKGLAGPDLGDWLKGAEESPGSWWPAWSAWLARRSGPSIPARAPGATLGRICPAPGEYVKVRFDRR